MVYAVPLLNTSTNSGLERGKPGILEVVGGTDGQTMQHQAVVVMQFPRTVQIGEIPWNLPDGRRHAADTNEPVANIGGPTATDPHSNAQVRFTQKSDVVVICGEAEILTIELVRGQHRGNFVGGTGIAFQGHAVVVHTEARSAEEVHVAACAPSSRRSQLTSEKVVSDMILIEEVISGIIEDVIAFARSELQLISELEPSETRKQVETQLAALGSIPWSARACWPGSAVAAATRSKEAWLAVVSERLASSASQRKRYEVYFRILEALLPRHSMQLGLIEPVRNPL